jgi:hypothetical protein
MHSSQLSPMIAGTSQYSNNNFEDTFNQSNVENKSNFVYEQNSKGHQLLTKVCILLSSVYYCKLYLQRSREVARLDAPPIDNMASVNVDDLHFINIDDGMFVLRNEQHVKGKYCNCLC